MIRPYRILPFLILAACEGEPSEVMTDAECKAQLKARIHEIYPEFKRRDCSAFDDNEALDCSLENLLTDLRQYEGDLKAGRFTDLDANNKGLEERQDNYPLPRAQEEADLILRKKGTHSVKPDQADRHEELWCARLRNFDRRQ